VEVDWRVELDGKHLASPSVSGCGSGTDHWKIVTLHNVPIDIGEHTLFLGTYQMDYSPDYCLDWVQIGDQRIEAEAYDRMGGNDPNPDYRGVTIWPRASHPPTAGNSNGFWYKLCVQIWDGDPKAGGKLICEDFVGSINTVIGSGHEFSGYTYPAYYIENFGQADIVYDWKPVEPGVHEIYVVIDPYDVLEEIDEENNTACLTVGILP